MRELLRQKLGNVISIFIWTLIILIFIIILVEALGLFEIPSFGALASALGALGTLLLAWVTMRTVRQNEDIITQRRAQFRPKVRRVGEYSVEEGLNDFLILELENVGSGKAIDLQITPELYILDEYPYQSLLEYTNELGTIPTAESHPTSIVTSDKNPLDYSHEGAVLESGETRSFALRPDWRNLDVNRRNFDLDSSEEPPLLVFERIIRLFGQTNVQKMGFRFQLTYGDIFGNSYEDVFIGPIFVLEEVDSLSDAIGRHLWAMEVEDAVIVHSEGRSG